MADKTAIEWADASWNPVTGCSHVSPGCDYCYAERLSHRYGWTQKPWGAQYAGENVVLKPERLDQPLRWKSSRRIFVNSLSDLFHEQIPDAFIEAVFAVMSTQRHTFQVLTKRPERMQRFVAARGAPGWQARLASAAYAYGVSLPNDPESWWFDGVQWPLANVWLGVSVEDQRRANERIPLLLETPAAVRFLSAEPLLGPIDLGRATPCGYYCDPAGAEDGHHDHGFWTPGRNPGIDWVITGGESGGPLDRRLVTQTGRTHGTLGAETWTPKPDALEWVRAIRDQCQVAGVAFLHKQWGGATSKSAGRLLDGRIWQQFPDGRGGIIDESGE